MRPRSIIRRERFDTGSRAAFGYEAKDGAFFLGAPQPTVAALVVVRLGDAERVAACLYLILKLPEVNFLKWLRIGFHISPTMLDRRLRPRPA